MSFGTYRRDVDPFGTDAKGTFFVVAVSINCSSERNWQTKVLGLWKATRLNLPRQKSVKASSSGMADLGFDSRLRRDFSGSSYTADLKIGTPVATLPGAWR